MADALTLDDLIAWGRDYEALLKQGASGFTVPRPMLDRYVTAANAALEQQREQERKKPRSRGGRPRGGMGEQVMRLIANGVPEKDAIRIVAAAQRAYDTARKKPPH